MTTGTVVWKKQNKMMIVFHSFKVFAKIKPEPELSFTSYITIFSVLTDNELLNGIIKTRPKYLICSSTNTEFFHLEKAKRYFTESSLDCGSYPLARAKQVFFITEMLSNIYFMDKNALHSLLE